MVPQVRRRFGVSSVYAKYRATSVGYYEAAYAGSGTIRVRLLHVIGSSIYVFYLVPYDSRYGRVIYGSFVQAIGLFSIRLHSFTFRDKVRFSYMEIMGATGRRSSGLYRAS